MKKVLYVNSFKKSKQKRFSENLEEIWKMGQDSKASNKKSNSGYRKTTNFF